MADTATTPVDPSVDAPDTPPEAPRDPPPEDSTSHLEPRRESDNSDRESRTDRGSRRVVPTAIHTVNGAAAAAGGAFTVAGPPGLAVVAAAGVAVGTAALVRGGRRRAIARRNAGVTTAAGRRRGGAGAGGRGRSSGSGLGAGGLGGGRRGSGGGASTGLGSRRTGAGAGAGAGAGGSGPGGRRGGRGIGLGGGTGTSGLSGGLGSRRRNRNGPGPGGKDGGTSGGNRNGRGGSSDSGRGSGRAAQLLKAAGSRLRRLGGGGRNGSNSGEKNGNSGTNAGASGTKNGNNGSGAAPKLSPRQQRAAKRRKARTARIARLRRIAARKTRHWLRSVKAALFAAVAFGIALPIGVLWGLSRTFRRRNDAGWAWALPMRAARRVWDREYGRSRRKLEDDEKADALTLTVDDPGKDSTPMSAPASSSTSSVLNGAGSRFNLSMSATYSAYIAARFDTMMLVAAEYAGLPAALRAVAETIQTMAINSDTAYPCSKRALLKLAEAAAALDAAGARGDGMVTLFRELHAFDIERIVSPRTNEWMWNVTRTGTSGTAAQMLAPGRLESGAVVLAVSYKTFAPTHMLDVGNEYAGMSMGLDQFAEAITALYERTRDQYPVEAPVTDEIAQIANMVHAAADHARLAAIMFEQDHAREIDHNLNPRKGPAAEGMWNAPHDGS